jgi:hypothetical protein
MRRSQSGATVVVVISVIATLAIFTGAALDYTFTIGKNVERSNKMGAANAIANGCLQEEFMYWREICRSSAAQGPPTSAFSAIPLPTQVQFPNVSNFTATTGSGSAYTVSNYSVHAVTPQLVPLAGSAATVPAIGTSGSNQTYYYLATATVNLPDRGHNVTFNAAEVLEQQYQNPWDWAIFYVDPLEIEPGPPFTVDGWVQTNSNLYTPLSTLTFGDKATFGENWYISTIPGDTHLVGDTYAPPTWPTGLPPAQGTPTTNPFGLNTSLFSTTDSNDNNNGYHELIQIPDPNYSDPLATERYFDNAGVKVILNSTGAAITATVYDNSQPAPSLVGGSTVLGNAIGTVTYNTSTAQSTAALSGTAESGYQRALFNTMSSALTFNQSLQDNREGATVALTQLNISALTTALGSGGALSSYPNAFNQVIYITDTTASVPGVEHAIQLINGATLPSNGLTIASDNPVYIQGDYNTGINPPSDSGNTAAPTASNYTRQPSSIIADAVDVLSNAWTNSESTNTEASRVATNTTVNAAIMAGIVPTTGDNYSGGAENFPRFLENWSNATFTYYGSMVELYPSQEATGLWGMGNVYSPPTRAWHYDSTFQIHPPPGTIMVVSYLKGQWYQY